MMVYCVAAGCTEAGTEPFKVNGTIFRYCQHHAAMLQKKGMHPEA